MRTRIFFGLGLLLAASVAQAGSVELTPSQVFELNSPSIVVVQAHDTSGTVTEMGSGVVISKDVVVSNCHVFTKADTATILYREKSLPAELLHGDVNHDLCSFTVKGLNAPAVQMGSTANLKVGEQAFAIGAPEGLQLTLSGGLISSLRNIPGGIVLQVTTPISPGSSGGGLFDSQGRLIGITSYYMGEGQQLNFALPVEWIRELPLRGKVPAAPIASSPKPLEAKAESANDVALERGRQAARNGDFSAALALFAPLAHRGDADAQTNLGWAYQNGEGVPQNYSKALAWYVKAAMQGNAGAQNNLGLMYAEGQGARRDYAKAMTWYDKAAAQGNANAQNALGSLFYHGQGVPQDYAKAKFFFDKAAEQQFAPAQYNLSLMYSAGIGVPRDEVKAAAWCLKAAVQGYASAQYNLGSAYYRGSGLPQDYGQAAAWFYKAAAQGVDVAQLALGGMYADGKGVTQDFNEAAFWYEKAAQQGNVTAQYNLGVMYAVGKGVPQDLHKAALWYEKAAQQGNDYAQFNLGVMYGQGNGVPQDYAEAVMWNRKAAAQGDALAQANLGVMYRYGQGVPQDFVIAYALYNLSASIDGSGQDNAAENRRKIMKSMSPRQIDAAQALTRQMQRSGVLEALDAYTSNR